MITIWDALDIRAGRRIRNPKIGEVWMIGYDPSLHTKNAPAFALISLRDGMISHKGLSPDALAHIINDNGEQPVELVGEVLSSSNRAE